MSLVLQLLSSEIVLDSNYFKLFSRSNKVEKKLDRFAINWCDHMRLKGHRYITWKAGRVYFMGFRFLIQDSVSQERQAIKGHSKNIQYRQPSLYAVFLSSILRICDPEMVFFLEPILKFMVILGLFICKFIIFESSFGVPISRI